MESPSTIAEVERFVEIELRLPSASIVPVASDGYSRAYRIFAQDELDLVLILHRQNKRRNALSGEQELLEKLANRGGCIRYPQLFRRTSAGRAVAGSLVSVYHWIDHSSYNGSPESKQSAFDAFIELHHHLEVVAAPAGIPLLALLRAGCERHSISFDKFAPLAPDDVWGDLFRGNIRELNTAAAFMGDQVEKLRHNLMSRRHHLIHYDPSVQNFGFAQSGRATAIFDFDQVKIGLVEYDVPWLLWSFASHGLDVCDRGCWSELLTRLSRSARDFDDRRLLIDWRLVWTLLLVRFCLTLYGRLSDTFERGFHNLRYMREKICAILFLVRHWEHL